MSLDDQKIAAMISDHRGIVVRVARSFASSPEDQEDLVQDILLRTWAARESFRGESKPSTWLYRVALNQALTWQRGETKRRKNRQQLIEVPAETAASDPDKSHRLGELYELIRTLPQIDRSLVVLSLDGFSYREIAEIVGVSESNVGARLSRARSRLRAADATTDAPTDRTPDHQAERDQA